MNNSTFLRQTFAALVIATLQNLAFAAEMGDHLNTQEPERPGYLPAHPGGDFQLPPVTPFAPPAMTGSEEVWIEKITFRGNTVIPTAKLNALVASYRHKKLNAADREDLRQRLTRFYIDSGYINSGAVLHEKSIQGNTLTYNIVEGRLTHIRLQGMERLQDVYVTEKLQQNAPLNMDVLRERFALLLDDPLFAQMNARLQPGDRPGEATLDMNVRRARPYQFTFFGNNYRPPSIGANVKGWSGWVRNLTGYGDVLEAGEQNSSQGHPAQRYSLGWRTPINQRGTQLSIQMEHGRSSVVEAPMQSLDIDSSLDSKEVGINQDLTESLRHKFTVGLNRVWRENRTTLLGEPFSFTPTEQEGLTKVSEWRFWQEYTHRAENQVLALRSTVTFGHNNLQDIPGLPRIAVQPQHDYKIWLGQVQYARRVLDNGAQFIIRDTFQYTKDTLVALERMSIGGVSTVRGYRENQMISDTGNVLNLELVYPLVTGQGWNWSLVPFYDYGRGKNQNETTQALSSIGFATRASWRGLHLDLAIAKRLVHPADVTDAGETLQDKGVHVQLGYDFF